MTSARRNGHHRRTLLRACLGERTTHLDGYNFLPFFKGEVAQGPRHEFFYFSDNADLMALRYNDWKISFKTSSAKSTQRGRSIGVLPSRSTLGTKRTTWTRLRPPLRTRRG